jgi:hypothetical protein
MSKNDRLADINEIREYLSHIWRRSQVDEWTDSEALEYYNRFENGFFNLK